MPRSRPPADRPSDPAQPRLPLDEPGTAAPDPGTAVPPPAITGRNLEGLVRVDCPTPREEAEVIALMLRQVLETPGRTAALVTPDRTLARRVAAALGRWGIVIDDSGGRPLGGTPAGSFLRLVIEAATRDLAPIALLALLKHPLAAGGEPIARFRRRARMLERAALRGPRPAGGLDGLRAAVDAAPGDRVDGPNGRAACHALIAALERRLGRWLRLANGGSAAPAALLEAHVAAAEALAATDTESGAARLWQHEDGEAAAGFIAELAEALDVLPPVDGRDYLGLWQAFIAGRVVRPRYGEHPRLAIWGPLEARLQQPDRLILGGLNEGTWPAEAEVDAWMSRPMRARFGLPTPEQRIGLAAHDVAQLLAAPEVLLTRAERVDGTPTVPSRWLLRLDAVLEAAGLALPRVDGQRPAPWLDWLGALDDPGRPRPTAPPAPRPPVAARPRRLSVTDVGVWMTDPYSLYARKILALTPLDPIEADPGAADRGVMIHRALHAWLAALGPGLPDDALERLHACGRREFAALAGYPGLTAFWWPRFERIAHWVVGIERQRRPRLRPLGGEVAGALTVPGPEGAVTLHGRADRIDADADGRLTIIDYKTGRVPTDKQIVAGYAPQLLLEAMIAEAGGFEGLPPAGVVELEHWRLSGSRPPGEIKPVSAGRTVVEHGGLAAVRAAARAGLDRLIARFDDPQTPYRARPRPDFIPSTDDYAHLARVAEWSATGTDDGP